MGGIGRFGGGAALIAAVAALLFAPTPSHAVDYDCGDFATQAAAQDFFIAAGGPGSDPHRLDGDGNGIACEANPCPCSTGSPAPTPPPSAPPPVPVEPTPVRTGVILERVVDGDTIEVRFPDDSLADVRLIGIDTPEKYGAGAPSAELMRPRQQWNGASSPGIGFD